MLHLLLAPAFYNPCDRMVVVVGKDMPAVRDQL